ncbi:Protein of unknown function, partial [Gryllus bimaculatus]
FEARQSVRPDASQDADPRQRWSQNPGRGEPQPQPPPADDQRQRYESRTPTRGDYTSDTDTWARYESRMRDAPIDLLRTRDSASESEGRPRFESRTPGRGGGGETVEAARAPAEGDGRGQRFEGRGAAKAADAEPKGQDARAKFPTRAEYDPRPAKPPGRTLAGEAKFSNGRGGPTTEEPASGAAPAPAPAPAPAEEQPRQRFEPRTPGKYSPRPATPPPPPQDLDKAV